MGWQDVILSLLFGTVVLGLEQVPLFRHPGDGASADWDLLKVQRPPKNTSYNLVFDSVTSLLQRWPNTRYRNGHNLVPGIIPTGTILHHGGRSPELPDRPEWVATDPEHSYIFAGNAWCIKSGPDETDEVQPGSNSNHTASGNDGPFNSSVNSTCWHLSMAAIRPLKVLYFDGSSAAKLPLQKWPHRTPSTSSPDDDDPVPGVGGGTMDTQDILIWGEIREDKVFAEPQRIQDLCAQWGRNGTEVADGEGFDGFVRMEMDFEVMICDFSASLELVTVLQPDFPARGGTGGKGPFENFVATTVIEAGSWHNSAPGETRVILDLPRLISFFDAGLFPSLASPRSLQDRWEHRLMGIAQEDIAKVKHVLRKSIQAQPSRCGIDWKALFQVITDRYTERLEVTQALVTTAVNSTSNDELIETAKKIQSVLRIMLHPYIPISFTAPESSSTQTLAAASPIFRICSTTNVKHLFKRTDSFTASERLMLQAISETNKEICRVAVKAWVRGVSLGLDAVSGSETTAPAADIKTLVEEWGEEIGSLMEWLGWSVWHKCRPSCALEEMCYLPTWPLFGPGPLRPSFQVVDAETTRGSLYLEMNAFRRWLSQEPREYDDEGFDWLDPQPRCVRRVAPYELGN